MNTYGKLLVGSSSLLASWCVYNKISDYNEKCKIKKINEIKHKQNTNLELEIKSRDFSDEYNKNVRPLSNDSSLVCRRWTNTSCDDAKEIILFIKKYKMIKAIKEKQTNAHLSPEDLKDYNTLEGFSKNGIELLHKIKNENIPLSMFCYPGFNELRFFSKFHWAIYQNVHNPTDKDNELYEWIRKQLVDGSMNRTDDENQIEEYRKTLFNEVF